MNPPKGSSTERVQESQLVCILGRKSFGRTSNKSDYDSETSSGTVGAQSCKTLFYGNCWLRSIYLFLCVVLESFVSEFNGFHICGLSLRERVSLIFAITVESKSHHENAFLSRCLRKLASAVSVHNYEHGAKSTKVVDDDRDETSLSNNSIMFVQPLPSPG